MKTMRQRKFLAFQIDVEDLVLFLHARGALPGLPDDARLIESQISNPPDSWSTALRIVLESDSLSDAYRFNGGHEFLNVELPCHEATVLQE